MFVMADDSDPIVDPGNAFGMISEGMGLNDVDPNASLSRRQIGGFGLVGLGALAGLGMRTASLELGTTFLVTFACSFIGVVLLVPRGKSFILRFGGGLVISLALAIGIMQVQL